MKFREYIGITLSVRLSVYLSVQIRLFFWFWLRLIIFSTWVYRHETMCRIHSWSQFNIDLRPQIKFIGFIIWLCVRATLFLSFDIMMLWLAHQCITIVRCVANIHDLFMTLTFDLNIKIIYFHNEFETGKIISLFDIVTTNFGIWMYHHETICCVHSWPLFYFDLWPICRWRGELSELSLIHSIILSAPSGSWGDGKGFPFGSVCRNVRGCIYSESSGF